MSAYGFIEHCLQTFLRQRRTLEEFHGADFLAHALALHRADRREFLVLERDRTCTVDRHTRPYSKFIDGDLIVAQIEFGTDEDDRRLRAVMIHLWIPLKRRPCQTTEGGLARALTLARTFSNEAGLTSEKQMRNTS
jgi:hypothetical protein